VVTQAGSRPATVDPGVAKQTCPGVVKVGQTVGCSTLPTPGQARFPAGRVGGGGMASGPPRCSSRSVVMLLQRTLLGTPTTQAAMKRSTQAAVRSLRGGDTALVPARSAPWRVRR